MATIAKLVKHSVEDEGCMVQDVELYEDEYIAHIQVYATIIIKGKTYKFDKMYDVELDLEEVEAG